MIGTVLDRITFDPGSRASDLVPVPWPAGLAPVTVAAPSGATSIPAVDVLVVTWTAAEARALADVLTPGVESTGWTAYTTGWASYEPQLTGESPARFSRRLGSWCLTSIGGKRVCCFKSELHPATDAVTIPAAELVTQVALECRARLVITTGTAGGAGDGTQLGDVNVASFVAADFTTKLKAHPWAGLQEVTAVLTDAQKAGLGTLGPLLAGNAAKLPGLTRAPRVWQGSTVSTDFFAFDTATDAYGLRKFDASIRAVEMDDAPVVAGLAGRVPVMSVRNASDPVMPGVDLAADKKDAERIYQDYGYYTTVGSAVACWSLIADMAA